MGVFFINRTAALRTLLALFHVPCITSLAYKTKLFGERWGSSNAKGGKDAQRLPRSASTGGKTKGWGAEDHAAEMCMELFDHSPPGHRDGATTAAAKWMKDAYKRNLPTKATIKASWRKL